MAESGLSLFSAAQMPTRCEGGVDCTSGGTVMGDRLSVGLVVVCHVRDCGVCVWRHLVSGPPTPLRCWRGGGSSRFLCCVELLHSQAIPWRLAHYSRRRGG